MNNIVNTQTLERTKLLTQHLESTNEFRSVISTQTALVKKEGLRLDESIKDLYLCHATSFFPNKGIIYPRGGYKINMPYKLKTVIEKIFPIIRPTVHFSVNSIVTEHSRYVEKDKQRFIIVDKFENALDKICGGYLEDIFCIGPYNLSSNATILAPESCKTTIQEKIKEINKKNIKIHYYEGNEEKALKNWLQLRKTNYIRPIEEDPSAVNFLCRFGNNRYVSSQSLMKIAKKPICVHCDTPTAQIENCISQNKVFLSTPFLNILIQNSYSEACNIIHQYIEGTKEVYLLNENQKSFINAYEKTIFLSLQIFSKAQVEELQNLFDNDNELIMQYDSEIDLAKRIDSQSTTQVLSKLTNLPFSPYYRSNCHTVIDAACLISLPEREREKLLKELKERIGLDFFLEEHQSNSYIVLKGINLAEIADHILLLKN